MPLNLRKSAINAKQTINCAQCLRQIAFFFKKKDTCSFIHKHLSCYYVELKNRKDKTWWIGFLIILEVEMTLEFR